MVLGVLAPDLNRIQHAEVIHPFVVQVNDFRLALAAATLGLEQESDVEDEHAVGDQVELSPVTAPPYSDRCSGHHQHEQPDE